MIHFICEEYDDYEFGKFVVGWFLNMAENFP